MPALWAWIANTAFPCSFLPELAAGKSSPRDDKGKGDGSVESGCWTEAFFITLGGPQARPQAHDSSGRDDNSIGLLKFIPPAAFLDIFPAKNVSSRLERSEVEGPAVSLPVLTHPLQPVRLGESR